MKTMVSNNLNFPKAIGTTSPILPVFTPSAVSRPSAKKTLFPSDAVSLQNPDSPNRATVSLPEQNQLRPESKVACGQQRERADFSNLGSFSGVGQGVGQGTLTVGIEGPAYTTNSIAESEHRYMGLLLGAHSGRALSEQDIEGLTDQQKADIRQAQVLFMTNQMARIQDLSQKIAVQIATTGLH